MTGTVSLLLKRYSPMILTYVDDLECVQCYFSILLSEIFGEILRACTKLKVSNITVYL